MPEAQPPITGMVPEARLSPELPPVFLLHEPYQAVRISTETPFIATLGNPAGMRPGSYNPEIDGHLVQVVHPEDSTEGVPRMARLEVTPDEQVIFHTPRLRSLSVKWADGTTQKIEGDNEVRLVGHALVVLEGRAKTVYLDVLQDPDNPHQWTITRLPDDPRVWAAWEAQAPTPAFEDLVEQPAKPQRENPQAAQARQEAARRYATTRKLFQVDQQREVAEAIGEDPAVDEERLTSFKRHILKLTIAASGKHNRFSDDHFRRGLHLVGDQVASLVRVVDSQGAVVAELPRWDVVVRPEMSEWAMTEKVKHAVDTLRQQADFTHPIQAETLFADSRYAVEAQVFIQEVLAAAPEQWRSMAAELNVELEPDVQSVNLLSSEEDAYRSAATQIEFQGFTPTPVRQEALVSEWMTRINAEAQEGTPYS